MLVRKVSILCMQVLDYREKCTVGKYAKLAVAEIKKAFQENKVPILVGGTGLYIKSILDGLVVIPEIEESLKKRVYQSFENLGKEEFYIQLINKDPSVADRVQPSDTSRMIRAMEVFMQTGKSISEFKDNIKKMYTGEYLHVSLFPEREILYKWCEQRFDSMIERGVVDEVRNFIDKREPNDGKYGVESSLGYSEIKNYLAGDVNMGEVKEKTKQATRNYAKRQLTWFRNQMPNKECLHYRDIRDAESEFFKLISKLTLK